MLHPEKRRLQCYHLKLSALRNHERGDKIRLIYFLLLRQTASVWSVYVVMVNQSQFIIIMTITIRHKSTPRHKLAKNKNAGNRRRHDMAKFMQIRDRMQTEKGFHSRKLHVWGQNKQRQLQIPREAEKRLFAFSTTSTTRLAGTTVCSKIIDTIPPLGDSFFRHRFCGGNFLVCTKRQRKQFRKLADLIIMKIVLNYAWHCIAICDAHDAAEFL